MKYPDLFRPIQIGGTLFRNRIFSAPTGHPDVSVDGEFSEDAVAYYERKAQGGAAVITLGEAIVDSRYGKRHPFQVSLDSRNSYHSLSQVADRIRRHGAVPSMELQHSGMYANRNSGLKGEASRGLAYGPVACEEDGRIVLAMDEADGSSPFSCSIFCRTSHVPCRVLYGRMARTLNASAWGT